MVKIFLFRNCVFVSQATSLRILLSYRLNQRNVSQEKKQVLLPIHDSFILLSSCINRILPKFHFILKNPIYWMLKISIFLIFIVTNCRYRINAQYTCKTWRKIQNTTYIETVHFPCSHWYHDTLLCISQKCTICILKAGHVYDSHQNGIMCD